MLEWGGRMWETESRPCLFQSSPCSLLSRKYVVSWGRVTNPALWLVKLCFFFFWFRQATCMLLYCCYRWLLDLSTLAQLVKCTRHHNLLTYLGMTNCTSELVKMCTWNAKYTQVGRSGLTIWLVLTFTDEITFHNNDILLQFIPLNWFFFSFFFFHLLSNTLGSLSFNVCFIHLCINLKLQLNVCNM